MQPFGGRGLSGTGPKAGGPLYIGRLVQKAPVPPQQDSVHTDPVLRDYITWLDRKGKAAEGETARGFANRSALGLLRELAGPVGERNLYALHPRGTVLLVPKTETGLLRQVAAALATGNQLVVDNVEPLKSALADLPSSVAARLSWSSDWEKDGPFAGALVEGEAEDVRRVNRKIAALTGPLVLVQAATTEELTGDPEAYCLNWLLEEVSTSINTAAAGGNASLMAIG